MIEAWTVITLLALQNAWQGFLNFVPGLIGAIIVFIIGWFIAIGIGRLVAEVLSRLKFNQLFERTGWREALEKAELKVNPSEFIGAIFKWILVIVFLMITVEILGLPQFAILLNKLLIWLPNLIVAIAILVVAVILADILDKVMRASVQKIGVRYVNTLGVILRWAIYIFAGLAVLVQLGVALALINTLITAFFGMFALAFGLAFGLGGKDAAAKIIEDLRKKVSE
jgi:hypothetical protein